MAQTTTATTESDDCHSVTSDATSAKYQIGTINCRVSTKHPLVVRSKYETIRITPTVASGTFRVEPIIVPKAISVSSCVILNDIENDIDDSSKVADDELRSSDRISGFDSLLINLQRPVVIKYRYEMTTNNNQP